MKIKTLGAGLASCLLITALSGCDNNKSSTNEVPKAAESAADSVKQATETAATEVKQAGEKAADAVAKQTETAEPAEATSSPASGLIEKAKTFVAEKKYQDALNVLKELKDVKLIPEQQKIVDGLKAQAEKLMSSGAVGNLLGK